MIAAVLLFFALIIFVLTIIFSPQEQESTQKEEINGCKFLDANQEEIRPYVVYVTTHDIHEIPRGYITYYPPPEKKVIPAGIRVKLCAVSIDGRACFESINDTPGGKIYRFWLKYEECEYFPLLPEEV
jgi:hypothetical protein